MVRGEIPWDLRRRGPKDAQRHEARVREAIRKNLRHLIVEETIISSRGDRKVRAPVRYLDQYRKTDGRWQFVRRTLVNDWAQVGPSYWDLEDPALKGTPVGRADPDDLSYAKLAHATFRRR